MGDWGDVGLQLVAEGVIYPNNESKGSESDLSPLELANLTGVLNSMVFIYRDVTDLVRRVQATSGRMIYTSPTHFVHFI